MTGGQMVTDSLSLLQLSMRKTERSAADTDAEGAGGRRRARVKENGLGEQECAWSGKALSLFHLA